MILISINLPPSVSKKGYSKGLAVVGPDGSSVGGPLPFGNWIYLLSGMVYIYTIFLSYRSLCIIG
jgi:hypothetical protein